MKWFQFINNINDIIKKFSYLDYDDDSKGFLVAKIITINIGILFKDKRLGHYGSIFWELFNV
jgi:hypothetical protein